MLTITRKVGSEAEYDRTNEIVLLLPDGRRCVLKVRGRGVGEVRVQIDAPANVLVYRGEIDPGTEGR